VGKRVQSCGKEEIGGCEFIAFNFLRHAKFCCVEKLETLGCMGIFEASDEGHP